MALDASGYQITWFCLGWVPGWVWYGESTNQILLPKVAALFPGIAMAAGYAACGCEAHPKVPGMQNMLRVSKMIRIIWY